MYFLLIQTFVTIDGFATTKPLLAWTSLCIWAQNADITQSKLKSRVYCLQWLEREQFGDITQKDPQHQRLVSSDTYFAQSHRELHDLQGGVPAFGMINSWLLAVVVLFLLYRNQSQEMSVYGPHVMVILSKRQVSPKMI